MIYNLEGHNSDLAIGFQQFFPWQQNMKALPICSSNLVAVMHQSNELSALPMLPLHLLADTPILFDRDNEKLLQFFQNLCATQKFWPNMDESNIRQSAIKQYLAQNLAVTFMADLYAYASFTEPVFRIIPVEGAKTLTLSIFSRNEPYSNGHKTFIDFIKNSIGN